MTPHPRPRIGKTEKDRANGKVPYRKNRRVKVYGVATGTDGTRNYTWEKV